MALTKITGQVVDTTTDLVVGVTTVGGGVSAVDGFFSGIVTFSNSVSVAGTLTYEDVTNIDAVGLVTARNGIVVGSGITLSKDGDIFATGITTVSGNVKVGTGITLSPDGDGFFTGVVTATSYYGDGSNLSNITSTTINSNADNRLITGSGTANTLNGESTLTFDGSLLKLQVDSGEFRVEAANGVDAFSVDSDNGNTIIGGSGNLTVSGGKLGIGTASGTRGLSVEGTGTASRAFFNDSTNHKAIEFGADSTGSFQSTLGDNPHLIYTNGTERARFTSDGLKFADGKGIDFSSRSGSASGSTSALFDDYEEGSWTPSFSAGETLTVFSARYTKIGRLVTANCYIYNFSDLSGNNSRFDIEGLPYTASGSNYHGGGFIGYIGTANYGHPILPLVVQGSNVGYFHRQDGTSATWKYVDMHNVGNGQNGHLIVTFVYETST